MLKNPPGPPFHNFRNFETVHNSHFSSDIRLSKKDPPIVFFNTIPILEVEVQKSCDISECLLLYIVFYELYCILRTLLRFTFYN